MDKKFKTRLIEALITLIIGLAATVIAVILIFLIKSNFSTPTEVKQNSTLQNIENNTTAIKQALTPYQDKDKMNKTVVEQNFYNSTQDGKATATFYKNLKISGVFSKGYLFIKTSINNKPIDNSGDIYIILQTTTNGVYREFGGHLITSDSLQTSEFPDHSELLYPLSDIRYKKDYQDTNLEVLSGNWLELFNKNGYQQIIGFTSTTEEGKIIDISIYYQCIESSACSIVVQ